MISAIEARTLFEKNIYDKIEENATYGYKSLTVTEPLGAAFKIQLEKQGFIIQESFVATKFFGFSRTYVPTRIMW